VLLVQLDHEGDCKVEPLQVTLNPADAGRLGIVSGARVRLESAIDSLEAEADIDDLIPPGAVYSVKGHWGSNVNRLNPGAKTDMGESTAVHAVAVKVTAL